MAIKESLQRLAVKWLGRGNLQQIENRGKNVSRAGLRRHRSRWASARKFDDQRYVQRRVVEKYPVRLLLVLSQAFSVISHDDDEGIVIPSMLLEMIHKIRQC